MKIITRLNVLLVSVAGLTVAGWLWMIYPKQFASPNCQQVIEKCYSFLLMDSLLIFVPVLVFVLITYKMKDQVFKPWAWFSVLFSVIYI